MVDFGRAKMTSLLMSGVVCTLTTCGFLLASERTAHWFVIPVCFCGIVIGSDAMEWLRGRLGLFDPAGIIGLMGVHFFFLAPLLHVAWDSWMPYVEPPPDWRDWLGGMALLNAAGLLLYRAGRGRAAGRRAAAEPDRIWYLDPRRLLFAAGCGLIVSGALQVWVYVAYGGISGYVDAFTQSVGRPQVQSAFAGMGWLFMVSESLPILAMIIFAVQAWRRPAARSWLMIVVVLLGFFVLKMLFGGLRGSRNNTVWGLFWAVGIVHLWVRPVSRRFVLAGLCFLVAFMYLYGFYKGLGGDVLTAYEGGLGEFGQRLDRTFDAVVLGDLARADVQAFLLYRLWMPDRDYDYAWGRTYLGSVGLLIPRRIWPDRPPTKVKEGTEALFGAGAYNEDEEFVSSKLYGLAGETMLNFGLVGVPFAYLLFGVIVGRFQRALSRLRDGDARLLLCPLVVYVCVSALHSDSDNLLFMFIKDGLVPLAVVWLGSRRLRHREAPASGLAPARS